MLHNGYGARGRTAGAQRDPACTLPSAQAARRGLIILRLPTIVLRHPKGVKGTLPSGTLYLTQEIIFHQKQAMKTPMA